MADKTIAKYLWWELWLQHLVSVCLTMEMTMHSLGLKLMKMNCTVKECQWHPAVINHHVWLCVCCSLSPVCPWRVGKTGHTKWCYSKMFEKNLSVIVPVVDWQMWWCHYKFEDITNALVHVASHSFLLKCKNCLYCKIPWIVNTIARGRPCSWQGSKANG